MSLIEHLPIFVVLIPLFAAPIASIFRNGAAARLIAQIAIWGSFLVTCLLLQQVLETGTVRYQLGGWEPPWGIEYRIDILGGLVLLIVNAIAALVISFSRLSIAQEIPERRMSVFYAAFLLCFTGLAGMTITGDAFNLFVFLEISSLSSYALISMGRDRRALSAAYQYLIMGSIGATFILIGIGFIYMMTGTLNMDDMAQRIPDVAETGTIRVGFAFVTVGFGLKVALFPLHLWLPNAYAYAPSAVSAFLAATATKVAIYSLLRFLLSIFGLGFALGAMPYDMILVTLGCAGIFSASLVAIFQKNVKRMLAYSSVAQIGYIVLGIGLANHTGVSAAITHIFNHAMMKGALFMALAAVMYRVGATRIESLRGLGRKMPLTMAAITISGLSLIGVPGTAGFISKWYLVTATIEAGLWPFALLVLLGSFMALIYIGRILEAAYFGEFRGSSDVREAPWSMLIPILILAGANIYFGLHTELSFGLADRATAALMETLP
jgi:multicomponent Na+:H+ antiporter subunit D